MRDTACNFNDKSHPVDLPFPLDDYIKILGRRSQQSRPSRSLLSA